MSDCQTCGGKGGHVGWCPEINRERIAREDKSRARRKRWRAEQDARKAALTGQVMLDFKDSPHGFALEFANGMLLRGSLTGREMDGHFDPPSDQSLTFEVVTREEREARTDAWHAFWERDTKLHGI